MIVTELIQLLTVYSILATGVKRSGIYVDDGDQMIPREISDAQWHYLRRLNLEFFNIPIDIPIKQKPDKLSSFLTEIHPMTSGNKSKTLRDQELENQKYLDVTEVANSINEAVLIATLAARNTRKPGVNNKIDKVKRLWFNISQIPPEDTITRGELKLFRSVDSVPKKNRGEVTIRVYVVASDRNVNGDRDMILVDSVNTTENNGWITLNVTEALLFWLRRTNGNRGLKLEAYSHYSAKSIQLENVGIVNFKGVPEKRPFLVVYGIKNNRPQRNVVFHFFPWSVNKSPFAKKEPRLPSACSRQNLYINFRDLNLDNIIVEPDGFSSFYCYGPCDYPLNYNMNATKTAHVQAYLNSIDPDRYEKPCCIAKEYSPITLTYCSHDACFPSVKQDMIVESCKCNY